MHTHETPQVQRHCDVAIVGGGPAGLAAALQLARQRRSVIVIDAGEPRNAPAAHMHSFLGHEGLPPSEFAALAREEVRSFGAEILSDRVERATRGDDDGRFELELAGGHAVVARKVLAATGVRDELPAIDGLAAHWGTDVISCPFCHGYEVRDRRVVQVLTNAAGLHPAVLFRHLSDAFSVVVHEGADIESSALDQLRRGGVDVVDGPVRRVVAGADGRIAALELVDGRRVDADAVVVGTRFTPRIEAFADLGLRAQEHPSGLGRFVQADPTGATSVAGLYAAGNLTDPSRQVLPSAADGSRVAALIAISLAEEDLQAAARASANQADWDHRYGDEPLWSGNPNGTLVREISPLKPGRALDVGAGEGGDAVWLAEQEWRVTAADVSRRALDRLQSAATARGLDVDCLHVDANARDAFEDGAFDLVTAHYAAIPRTRDHRAINNLMNAVAPGGTLLFVGHDLEAFRTPIEAAGHGNGHGRPFDPDAYVRVADVAAALGDSPEWQIETWEKRPRPAGAASAAHHVLDEVLRARRSPAA